ncbi:MAG: hypothetical protein LBD40_03680 [Puniceicoccales bacterium]|jgi:hypothetical protein|nr:hypothetical protein [Puniceicoccales bacterium]
MYRYCRLVIAFIFWVGFFFPITHVQADPGIDPYTGKSYASLDFRKTMRVFRREFPHKPLFTWHDHYVEKWLIRLIQLYSKLQNPQEGEAAFDFLRYLVSDSTFKVYFINALIAALIGEPWITEEGRILNIDELEASPQLSADAAILYVKLIPQFTYEDLQKTYKRLQEDMPTLLDENSPLIKGLSLANTNPTISNVMGSFAASFFPLLFSRDIGESMVQCLTKRAIFMALSPALRRKISEASASYFLWQGLEETFQGKKLLDYSNGRAQYGLASERLNPDDLSTLTDDIFSAPEPAFPPHSFFEIDLHRSPFTLIIGRQILTSEMIRQEIANATHLSGSAFEDKFKEQIRKKVLDAIMTLATEHGLDPVEVLKNFLSTYVGQAASSSLDLLCMYIISDDMTSPRVKAQHFPPFSPGHMDHTPVVITIYKDGTCEVRHDVICDTLYSMSRVEVLGPLSATLCVPCAIIMRITYKKSLYEERPHAVEEQCFAQGFVLDIFNQNHR